jgi:hypothetical protein
MFRTKIGFAIGALALGFTMLSIGTRVSFAEDVKIPQTAADHEAMAKQYREEAAQYRKVAQEHQEMAAAYAKVHPDTKAGKNQWTEKMKMHCDALRKDAEKLAADADKAADFHSMRAKELQGK